MVNKFTNNDSDIDPAILKELMSDTNTGGSSLYQTQDMSKLVKTFLDENIPETVRESPMYNEFWAVLGNTIKLSFLEKEDMEDFETLFEISRIDYIMSKPVYEYTFDDTKHIEQLRIYFMAACKRAVGFGSHRFNERISLAGSINQVVRSNTEAIRTGEGSNRGFFSKIRGMF